MLFHLLDPDEVKKILHHTKQKNRVALLQTLEINKIEAEFAERISNYRIKKSSPFLFRRYDSHGFVTTAGPVITGMDGSLAEEVIRALEERVNHRRDWPWKDTIDQLIEEANQSGDKTTMQAFTDATFGIAFLLSAYRLHKKLMERSPRDKLVISPIKIRYSKATGNWRETYIDEKNPFYQISFGK